MVTLPCVEGQLGIYPQHVPLITELVPGEIIAHRVGSDRSLAVGSGLVDIATDRVAIVTDMAVAAEHIDCLLYTSPSPRDRQKSRMPSSA